MLFSNFACPSNNSTFCVDSTQPKCTPENPKEVFGTLHISTSDTDQNHTTNNNKNKSNKQQRMKQRNEKR